MFAKKMNRLAGIRCGLENSCIQALLTGAIFRRKVDRPRKMPQTNVERACEFSMDVSLGLASRIAATGVKQQTSAFSMISITTV